MKDRIGFSSRRTRCTGALEHAVASSVPMTGVSIARLAAKHCEEQQQPQLALYLEVALVTFQKASQEGKDDIQIVVPKAYHPMIECLHGAYAEHCRRVRATGSIDR